ncbi:unnamed protein product [Trichogramma brassicae]|uniref:LRRCT domain-containing protein n=1 Tax=Trichogramma brassicae TaxID=86971 RepID=A0A6H5I6J0_9HYME|nr:unnamed protein product [Trichogramma brassicae]
MTLAYCRCLSLSLMMIMSVARADETYLEELEARVSSLERRMRAIELPVWQISQAESKWDLCARGPCKCRIETSSLSCWKLGLADLPAAQVVPDNVLKLDLSSNKLRTLPEGLFSSSSSLVLLDLSSNRLGILPSKIFHGLCILEELLLGHNQLNDLPADCFSGLKKLHRLTLDENRLDDLDRELFSSLESLIELNLRDNRLQSLQNGVFESLNNLKTLDLSKNKITYINAGAFRGLSSLIQLELGNNRLRRLTRGLFEPLTSLERLGNRLSHLPKGLFDENSDLLQLRLGRNPWHCDCASSYLALWLRRRYRLRLVEAESRSGNGTTPAFGAGTNHLDFTAGLVCRGPGTLGGQLLVKLSYRLLCDGEWASMKGFAPRIPVEFADEMMLDEHEQVMAFFSHYL